MFIMVVCSLVHLILDTTPGFSNENAYLLLIIDGIITGVFSVDFVLKIRHEVKAKERRLFSFFGIELVIGDAQTFLFTEEFFGALIQYPDLNGEINDYKKFTAGAHAVGAGVAVATDLLALTMITKID